MLSEIGWKGVGLDGREEKEQTAYRRWHMETRETSSIT